MELGARQPLRLPGVLRSPCHGRPWLPNPVLFSTGDVELPHSGDPGTPGSQEHLDHLNVAIGPQPAAQHSGSQNPGAVYKVGRSKPEMSTKSYPRVASTSKAPTIPVECGQEPSASTGVIWSLRGNCRRSMGANCCAGTLDDRGQCLQWPFPASRTVFRSAYGQLSAPLCVEAAIIISLILYAHSVIQTWPVSSPNNSRASTSAVMLRSTNST